MVLPIKKRFWLPDIKFCQHLQRVIAQMAALPHHPQIA